MMNISICIVLLLLLLLFHLLLESNSFAFKQKQNLLNKRQFVPKMIMTFTPKANSPKKLTKGAVPPKVDSFKKVGDDKKVKVKSMKTEVRFEDKERLQKLIARLGLTSSPDAEKMILEGKVKLNGKVVTELGLKADLRKDTLQVDRKLITIPKKVAVIPKVCSPKDLKNLSKEEMCEVLEYLIFHERPQILAQLNESGVDVEGTLTEEKNFYFQTIEDLSNKIVQYHNENMILKAQVNILEEKLTIITSKLDAMVQPISARQIASDTDVAAMNFIFPEARQKPFCLRSLGNLISFIENPKSSEFTSRDGPAEWEKLGAAKIQLIQDNQRKLLDEYEYLKISIKTLKGSAWKHAHSTTTVDETINFYKEKGDTESVEAVEECVRFLESRIIQNGEMVVQLN